MEATSTLISLLLLLFTINYSHSQACTDKSTSCKKWAQLGLCQNNLKQAKEECDLTCFKCGETPVPFKMPQGTVARPFSTPIRRPSKKPAGDVSPGCYDVTTMCATWAALDECRNNPFWMLPNCRISCDSCIQQHNGGRLTSQQPTIAVEVIRKQRKLTKTKSKEKSKQESREMVEIEIIRPLGRPLAEKDDLLLPAPMPQPAVQLITTPTHQGCWDYNIRCSHWAAQGECRANPRYMLMYCQQSCRQC